MYKYLFLISGIVISNFLYSSNNSDNTIDIDDSDDKTSIVKFLDSLLNEHYCQYNNFNTNTSSLNIYNFDQADLPVYPDSIIETRLEAVSSPIPLDFNQYSKPFIKLYSFEKREQVSRMLGLSNVYYPMIEKLLDQKNLPLELKHLPIIESALNPNAVSRAGATGMWQLMYNTGKMYGLNINSYIDERRDPYKSTVAALNFLEDLYNIYGDWLLVIAAYNCGPGNVNKAIRRSGGKTNFWKIRRYLPRETRGYVPAFIAANYIMNYPSEHNIYPQEPSLFFTNNDTVKLRQELSFEVLTNYIDFPIEELIYLNPSVKKGYIPKSMLPFTLNLPFDKIQLFDQLKDSIFVAQKNILDKNNSKISVEDYSTPYNVPSSKYTKLTYTVKTGNNLGFIAEWYDCRAQDIRNWNNIYGSKIRIGQKLYIYKLNTKVEKYKNINSRKLAQKQSSSGKPTHKSSAKLDKSYVYYEVRNGDTLWDIAKLYNGIDVDDIKNLNNISNGKRIKPGMMLKIRKA
ncbi:transglycosylase SLT domain-containing protein [Sphingobacteriaceae bacterium AH-315-L07]|nr:transglycosylase SLT domain-containing protein [Sphingobacteriaceae bacterium AH-315-L07]